MIERRSGWRRAGVVLYYCVLVVMAAATLLPLAWMVLSSFKTAQEISLDPPTWIPRVWHWQNYLVILQNLPFARWMLNSIWVAGWVVVVQVFTCSMAAYGFSRLRFPGRDYLFLGYLATLMIPAQVTIIPLFILVKDLGLINTYTAIILPSAFSAFGTFLMKQFFTSLPRELDEAARIDGCGYFQTYWRIVLPLSKPALATLAVLTFLAQWNNLMWPLVVTNSETMKVLAVGLRTFQGQYANEWHQMMAAATLAVAPVVLLYLAAQRYFVEGITLTGMGGR